MGGPQRPPKQKAPPKEDVPETHAAPGASDSLIPPGSEPALPDDPLELKDSIAKRIGSDMKLDEPAVGRSRLVDRSFYGLYYHERSGAYQLRFAFPLWFERQQPSLTEPKILDRASLFGGLYYNRRSAERADDVLFPVFWNLVNKLDNSRTTIVGPLVNRVAPGERDNWLAPLYFTGKRAHGGYTIIPPLLTYTSSNEKGGFNLVGPAFCSWKGGQHCDTRSATDIDLGVAPFYFFGQNEQSLYEVIPPLLHYYRYENRDLSWVNIWGPYYRSHTKEREALHILPLYYSLWGKDERHTTFFPFFHYGHKGNSSLFVNPLYLFRRGDKGETTFATWGYARHRGRTELDMITPLFWHYRDPDIGLEQNLLFPLFLSRTSPRENNLVLFPFYAHLERYGVSETHWITPFFQHSTDLRGWSTNIHPILYLGRDGRSTHTVIAPFFWDFSSPGERATVGFPVYWRFSDLETTSQLVGNVYYQESRYKNGKEWEVHVFPAFSYGETPDGHWWNILYGLAGYTRRGTMTKVRTLWIPITLSE